MTVEVRVGRIVVEGGLDGTSVQLATTLTSALETNLVGVAPADLEGTVRQTVERYFGGLE